MEKSLFKFSRNLIFILLLISCQTSNTSDENLEQGSLSSDNGLLDLSLTTIEQQNMEKAKAEKFLLEVREKRIVIEPDFAAELNQKSAVNVALYAIRTQNEVGQKIYERFPFKQKKLDPCLRFVSTDDAQRFFLKNNGPKNDLWNLDPDGDGFACKWNPLRYRKLLKN